jgi:acetamidase/formamidase
MTLNGSVWAAARDGARSADLITEGDINMANPTPIARVTRDQYHYAVGPDISPAIEITPGQEVVVETMDCFTGAITNSAQRFNSVADLLKVVPGLNPVAGPIAVTGTAPGDVVAVHVLDIRVGRVGGHAITMILPDFGGLCNPHTLVTRTWTRYQSLPDPWGRH